MSEPAAKLGGSCDHAAAMALEGGLKEGLSLARAKYLAHVARFGGVCWQKDRVVREAPDMLRPDGKPYHPKSFPRFRRILKAGGFIQSTRLFSGQKVPEMRVSSSTGTTANRVVWARVGIVNPFTRGEARRARARQGRPPAPLGPSPDERLGAVAAPRYSSAVGSSPLSPELASLIAEYEQAMEPRWERAEVESLPDLGPGNRPGNERPPPD